MNCQHHWKVTKNEGQCKKCGDMREFLDTKLDVPIMKGREEGLIEWKERMGFAQEVVNGFSTETN